MKRVPCLHQQAQPKDWRAYDQEGLGKVAFPIALDQLQRLDLAFQAFFRRVKGGKNGKKAGYPTFHRVTHSLGYQVQKGTRSARDSRVHGDCMSPVSGTFPSPSTGFSPKRGRSRW
jgi:hypothetical protein